MPIATRNIQDGAVTAAKLASSAVTSAKLATGAALANLAANTVTKDKLAGAFMKVDIVAGQDETMDTTIPVTGMVVGDELVAVIVLATTAAIATATKRANADFTVTAGNLTVGANAANNTNNSYLIFWLDLT